MSSSEDDDDKQPTGQYDDDDSEEEVVKRKPKKKSKDKSKYIDDAAEESDGEGGNVDDEDDEDDEDDDEQLKGKGVKRGRDFIVDEDEDVGGHKRERVHITRDERKLDDEDYSLIQENLGLQVARQDSSDEEDGDQPQRKRLRQGARLDSDDDDEGKKVSRKKGLAGALFDDDEDGNEGAAEADAPRGRRTGYGDGMDSDDSMADFIEDDDDVGGQEGEGGFDRGEARARPRKSKRRAIDGGRAADMNRIARADDMFGDDEYDDEYAAEEEEEEAPVMSITDMYEPAIIQEFFLADDDVRIRNEDLPERLQLDMSGREIVSTLSDVREEAKWMVTKSNEIRWRNQHYIDDTGTGLVDVANPAYTDGNEEERRLQPQFLQVTRSERAERFKNSLIEKVTNVLCFFRGIANDEIQHGGAYLVSKDDKRTGVPNWWLQKDPDTEDANNEQIDECPLENISEIRASFDIPFIQHYRKEYYQPDLTARDLWSIYDLDAKYCAILSRQRLLISTLRDLGDEEGIKTCKTHDSEEGLADVKALVDLKYPANAGENKDEAVGGRKKPIRVSRYKVCSDAGLGKLVKRFCISPKELSENLGGWKKHHPEDPAEDPAEYASDYVIEAEKYGFREAATVLDGCRQMAAKELSVEPFLRRYVREFFFEPNAMIRVTITSKGDASSDEYHREFKHWINMPMHEIDDEDFLLAMRAFKAGLIEIQVSMPEEREEEVLRDLLRFYRSDNQNPTADVWNAERRRILAEALNLLYKVLEQNLVDKHISKARHAVANHVTDELEKLLRVPPYQCRMSKNNESSNLVAPERIMACCFAKPTEFVVIDKHGEVVGFKSIQLRVSRNHNNPLLSFSETEYRQLRSFFEEQTPDVVVLGGDGLQCKPLQIQLERACDEFHTQGVLTKPIDVLLADQRVAYKYAHSPRGLSEFPRFTPTRLMAVSLARRLQDPLRELSGLCAGLGEDVLSLQLHPLQDMLHKADRLKCMQRAFVNVVNEVGVDINLAADRPLIHGNTVQFVAGLGPRKARELLRIIAKNLYVEHRAALLEDGEVRTIMREVVWYNCAAFFKITKNSRMWTREYDIGMTWDDDAQAGEYKWYAGGPLEGTRIHPESYKYARQMAADALEEEDGTNECLKRALHGSPETRAKFRKELDEELDIVGYGKLLQDTHGVLKTITLSDIRNELIFPFEEARLLPVPVDGEGKGTMPWDLTKQQEFNLLTGESMTRRAGNRVPQSTLIDQVVHVKVIRVIRPNDFSQDRDGQDKALPYKVLCKLENGLMGVVMDMNFADNEEDKEKFQRTIREDMTISCVIIGVKFEEFSVELTHKTSRLRLREMAMGISKPEKMQQSKIKYVRRNIHHPYFKNLSRNGAIAALKEEEVGEFIIRPSSQGMDLLTITRKVWADPERIHETVIKMYQQPNKMALGKSLQVEDKVFEDLDELIIGYVEVIGKLEKRLIEHDKFFGGEAADIRKRLIEQKQSAGGKSTPYCIGFPSSPSATGFILFWLPGTKTVHEEKVKVTVDGYTFRGQSFQSPSRLLNWFKGHAMDLMKQQQPPPPPYQPLPAATSMPPNQAYPPPLPPGHPGYVGRDAPMQYQPPPPGGHPPPAGYGMMPPGTGRWT